MKKLMLVLATTLSHFSLAALDNRELDLACIRNTGRPERKVWVNLKIESLQMTVKLDNGQTIRGAATETVDHASGRRRYYLENDGFPYRFEIGLTLDADENAPSGLFLKKGAYPFECRKQAGGPLP